VGFEGEGKGIEGIEALKNGVIGLEIENLLEVTVQKKSMSISRITVSFSEFPKSI
jgi:hypothetical protein